MNKKITFKTTFIIWVLSCTVVFAQDSIGLKYSNYIQQTIIKKHLEVLASDSLEGRETAKPGMEKAARYVAEQFKSMGIPPVNNGSYFQEFPLLIQTPSAIKIKSAEKEYVLGEDYFAVDGPPTYVYTTSEIIFAGYGIVDSASGWNDYQNIDVAGKTVFIYDGEPVDKKGNSLITKSKQSSSWKSDRRKKMEIASKKNAAAVFMVNQDFKSAYERVKRRTASGRMSLDDGASDKNIPVIYLSPEMGDKWLSKSGYTKKAFTSKIGKKKKPVTGSFIETITVTGTSQRTSCKNVLGFVEGTSLKEEVIIVTAHLDHLGIHEGKIYYGADDDGSGCASIINMAEALMKAKSEGNGPKRSVLFMTFSGEEKGLLGSEYYANNPVFPLKNTVVNLNIDMIGRLDTIQRNTTEYTYIIGSDKLSTGLHQINETANNFCCDLELDYKYNDPSDKLKLYYRSDHYNFAKNNIPVIFYFTGLHPDYHKPTDTIDKIDFNKTAKIAKLVFNTAWELANRNERIVVDVKNDFK